MKVRNLNLNQTCEKLKKKSKDLTNLSILNLIRKFVVYAAVPFCIGLSEKYHCEKLTSFGKNDIRNTISMMKKNYLIN
ncbi:hypothetical protein BpHYR1_043732 [Brachionus plicatilis]|uniref:Uncharacterized protein n=1 Tax=Brachionus plicatilis TaxID=10195 RepID=A0A3M7PIC9_BRAPC|nr:hypothetical protein BpHYR1_043732 [Brachionus plicatilis]